MLHDCSAPDAFFMLSSGSHAPSGPAAASAASCAADPIANPLSAVKAISKASDSSAPAEVYGGPCIVFVATPAVGLEPYDKRQGCLLM